MTTSSPVQRRATYTRDVPEQLTRTTRSMARLSDAAQYPNRSTSQAESSRRQLPAIVSSASRLSSRQLAREQTFEPESPEAKPVAQMQSPKKGRFGDFEFELEDNVTEVPVRRRRLEQRPPVETARAPPSRHSSTQPHSRHLPTAALASSRKENTSVMQPESNLVKAALVPRISRLIAPVGNNVKRGVPDTEPVKRASAVHVADAELAQSQTSSRQLTFTATYSPMKQTPFTTQNDVDSLARLGEARHSPIKRSHIKSEFVLQSPERPDRKPINLLDLKPSPGKAQRGIFRHNLADEDDAESTADVDEAKPTSRPSLAKAFATAQNTPIVAIPSRESSSAMSRTEPRKILSAETKDALASLEASLIRLSSRSNAFRAEADSQRDHFKRALVARSSMLPSSRTQVFTSSRAATFEESSSVDKTAHHDGDEGLFKKPVGRVSALSKSRQSSTHLQGLTPGSTSETPSEMVGSLTASKVPAPDSSLSSPGNNDIEEQRQRRAALQAARRRSTQSVLSAGMPPPMFRRTLGPGQDTASTTASSSVSSTPSNVCDAEQRKEAREARRRSLYTYVPTKREDVEHGDRSVGNVSASMVICSAPVPADADGSVQAVKRTRFLRGFVVLVDVRDQDGEDASARWVEMLKNAGAKVMLRFGERKITHIVYKSGRPSTLHSYRALPDPKPHVVGISWVVKCFEEGQPVDEEPYLVEVAKQAIFTNRRLSMAPKQAPVASAKPRERTLEEKRQELEQARQRLLAHAPPVSSPLRKRLSTRTLASTSLQDPSACCSTDLGESFTQLGLAETSTNELGTASQRRDRGEPMNSKLS